ncbi:class I adenylate-forming enzyme family protein [Cognatishimia activa]|uniref:Benzoate--CoA ligase n=1 Tax=Cognatishimia activa TaxID=1715691 RepID=A0A0P1IPB0_9RHOB|nr:class I adenylate-forming enzyme family protein [Cognatishimia activa]CUJ25715.1 Benzoate--CoA ligase [Cognatishimia activa]CUK25323.1 Benzoate--CoA ligase [Cognatishimia activa]
MLSVFDKGALPPCPAPFNMAQYVLRHAADLSEKTALSVVSKGSAENYSFGEIESAVLGIAQGFLDLGLTAGDLVLIRLGNTVDFPITYLAALAVGLVPVPTSSLLTDREVDKMLDELKPALVVHAPGIAIGNPECLCLAQSNLVPLKSGPKAQYQLGDPNRLAYIVYTSGTSGQPRAVMHAHRAIWARQMMFEDWTGLSKTDRLLHAGAFNWTFTLGTGLMDPWSLGATSLILEPDTDINEIGGILNTHQATLFAAVPGIFRKLLHSKDLPSFPALRHALSAGEKLSEPLREQWNIRTGTDILEAFGMSECSTFVSHAPGRRAAEGALGRPQTGRHVALINDTGPVPIGETGQVAVSKDDPGLMLGYLNAPEETQHRFQGDWFLTGDLGCMDEDGSIHYEGRADDMMNAGGFRVSPLEVEHALAACPGLQQIGVTDVEVKADTHLIAAFYVADENVTQATLETFAKDTLARYKQPRIYQRVDVLPTNANGKLNRKRLRAEYKAPSNGSDQT